MTERFEAYVADPAEPAPRPVLDRWRVTVWTMLVVVLLAGLVSIYMVGRGEEDPALQQPGQDAGP